MTLRGMEYMIATEIDVITMSVLYCSFLQLLAFLDTDPWCSGIINASPLYVLHFDLADWVSTPSPHTLLLRNARGVKSISVIWVTDKRK